MRKVHLAGAVKQSSNQAVCSQPNNQKPAVKSFAGASVPVAANVPVVRMLPTFSFPVSY